MIDTDPLIITLIKHKLEKHEPVFFVIPGNIIQSKVCSVDEVLRNSSFTMLISYSFDKLSNKNRHITSIEDDYADKYSLEKIETAAGISWKLILEADK